MLLVPLDAVAAQNFTVSLSNQACQLSIYQKMQGLFLNLQVNNSSIIGGVICLNQVRIVRDLYLGFAGDFFFYDTQGNDDPIYTGLGNRFQLVYVEPSDLPPGVG